MKVTLVTPEKKLFTDRETKEIFVPGQEGELNILDGHAAFMSTLTTGCIKLVDPEGKVEAFSVCSGYCEINEDRVMILAETAESSVEVDIDRAEKSYKRAQEKLEQAGLTVPEYEQQMFKVKKASTRIELAREFRENH
ncbi:MAG: ATP synthase F1 subunit epsilon [Bdellovibrionales bacterium]